MSEGLLFTVEEYVREYDGHMAESITEFVKGSMLGIREAFVDGWNACAAAQSKEESSGTASNSDYTAALRVYEEFMRQAGINRSSLALKSYIEQRLNSVEQPNCA